MGNVLISTLSSPVVRRVSKTYSFMFLMSLSPLFPPPLQLSQTKSWLCVCSALWTVSLLVIKNKGSQTFVGIYRVVINPVHAIHMFFKCLHITSAFFFFIISLFSFSPLWDKCRGQLLERRKIPLSCIPLSFIPPMLSL